METKDEKGFLNRSRLRDVILVCAFVSAPFCSMTDTTVVIGFFLLALGCFFHLVAKGILIRNVVLCNGGLYGFVRHPYYLANYLIDWSFCVLSGNYLLVLAYPFAFLWSYGPTMRKEEGLLASEYGEEFVRYESEVPQVFPDRNSIAKLRTIFEGFSPQRITWKECARLTRFCSAAILLTLVHDVAMEGLNAAGLRNAIRNETYGVFFSIAAVLYVASVTFIILAKRHRSHQ